MPLVSDPTPLLRLTPAHYADGVADMGATGDAATIAATVFDQDGDMPNFAGLSALAVFWGQFIDHDLSLTRDASGEFVQAQGLAAPFQRSVYEPVSGTAADNPRLAVNEITPEIDAGMVYGSTPDRTAALRSFEGGRLRMQDDGATGGPILPFAADTDVMAGLHATPAPIFLAGDIRANENVMLTALHTLFAREHNFWADRLATDNPGWTDEAIFQAARAIVEYEVQTVTYRDWLPHLLGARPLVASPSAPAAGLSGQISVEFSTAAYRVGHTMVPGDIRLLEESGTLAPGQVLKIRDFFFNPEPITAGHLDDLLRGQTATMAQEVDGKVIDDLNFFLLGPDGVSGFSLVALNILRSRDHGLDRYLEVRAALLGDVDPSAIDPADFSVIATAPAVQAALAAVYDSVHEVDLWVGGLVEDKPDGAQLGPLFAHIIADQFFRTRAADDGFQRLPQGLPADLAAEIRDTGLRDILLRNTGIETMQDDPFVAMDRLAGSQATDLISGTSSAEFLFGLGGADLLRGKGGDDVIVGGPGNDTIEGGAGQDVAGFAHGRGAYWIELRDGEIRVTDKTPGGDGMDILHDVETLSFLDGDWSPEALAGIFDLSGGDLRALVELYIACFDRAPDSAGLLFWASALAGGMALDEIAARFFDQDEMRAAYPDPSDFDGFVRDVYGNVLGREVDSAGHAFWTGVLEAGAVPQAGFVLALLNGAKAPAPAGASEEFKTLKASDMAFLEGKADLGLYYAVIMGMNDVENGRGVMDMYDGSEKSLWQAKGLADDCYFDALGPDSDEALLSLVGIAGSPFEVTLDTFFL